MSPPRRIFSLASGATHRQMKEILAPHRGALALLVLVTIAAAGLELVPLWSCSR